MIDIFKGAMKIIMSNVIMVFMFYYMMIVCFNRGNSTETTQLKNGTNYTGKHMVITVMPLGDSITAGGGINPDGSRSSGYRLTFYTNVTSSGINVHMQGVYNPQSRNQDGFCPYLYQRNENSNNGYPGYTSGDILANLAGQKQAAFVSITNQGGYWLAGKKEIGRMPFYPDFVLLMVGINDLGKNIPLGDPASVGTLEGNMAEILGWFRTNRPSARILVGTLLPTTHSKINEKVDIYNAWLASYIINFSSCQLVDTHAVFMDGDVVKKDYLLSDGTHPTIKGYVALGNAWAKSFKVASGIIWQEQTNKPE